MAGTNMITPRRSNLCIFSFVGLFSTARVGGLNRNTNKTIVTAPSGRSYDHKSVGFSDNQAHMGLALVTTYCEKLITIPCISFGTTHLI